MEEKPKKTKSNSPRRAFMPRFKKFDHEDLIDQVRVYRVQKTRFSSMDMNIAHKLSKLKRGEFGLYAFYCLMSGFDQSRQGLSDYSVREIATALNMSPTGVIERREALVRHGLIAYKQHYLGDTRSISRTVTQVLCLERADTLIARRFRDEEGVTQTDRGVTEMKHPVTQMKQGVTQNDWVINRRSRPVTPLRRESFLDDNALESDRKNAFNGFNHLNYLVEELTVKLDDPNSIGFYRMLVQYVHDGKLPESTLRDALGETMHAHNMGNIRTNKARFFTDLVIRYAEERGVLIGRKKTWLKS